MQGYGPPPGEGGGGYEFNDAENKIIGGCALWARVLAIILYVLGALGLLQCNVFTAAINGVVGTFLLLGGNSLSAVVRTQGNDVANMMQALSKLRTAFAWRVWFTVAIFGLVAIALVFFVLMFARAASATSTAPVISS
jgi:hypothetical protein